MSTWRQVLYVQVHVLAPQVQVRAQVLQNCTRVQVQVPSTTSMIISYCSNTQNGLTF